MSKELPLIILNPKSGQGISEQKWASMASLIRTQLGPFECEFTRATGDGIRLAGEAASAGRKLIIACGGDGTISEVANGILASGADAELGLLPGGTGGDFRRTLGVPAHLGQAASRLKNGSSHLIDVGKLTFVNHDGEESTRYFINTASFGMSGKVATRANQSSKTLGGTITYAAETFRAMLTFDFPEIALCWDDQPPKRLKIATVCVANGPSFGGGMRIAPDAKVNDGVFDVVIIGDMKLTQMILNSHRLYTGSFHSLDRVALTHAKVVSAEPMDSRAEVLLEVDGETPGRLPAKFEIQPGRLRVRC